MQVRLLQLVMSISISVYWHTESHGINSCFEPVLFLGFSVIVNLHTHCVLYNLSLSYLCIPATSASLEHSFSSVGLTVSALRSRLMPILVLNLLTGSHVGTLNLLHCNQAFFKLQVSTDVATKKCWRPSG